MTPSDPAAPRHEDRELRGTLARIEVRLHGKLRYYDSELHGLAHLREVALLAGRIACESDLDVELAMVAGFLHDCGRMNDDGGNAHALDSALLARPLLEKCFPRLDAEAICRAIAEHANGTTTEDPLAGAVWDADRLTLERIGVTVRDGLLSTEAGKRILRARRARPG